jgi:predicted metal-dependent enzyme (double-stranded beta helix superfamily)
MDDDEKRHWTNTPPWRKLQDMSTTPLLTPVEQLGRLVTGVRTAVDRHADWSDTAQLVADQLRAHLPGRDVLTSEQRLGSPDRQASHPLHVEPDGSFSIVAVVWRPGQVTPIHDHTTWCVFGVIQGVEHEDVFDADLNPIGHSDNRVGDVSGFAPPGDIHRVHNTGDEVAISVHIYGTDVTRIGSSVRRYYTTDELAGGRA